MKYFPVLLLTQKLLDAEPLTHREDFASRKLAQKQEKPTNPNANHAKETQEGTIKGYQNQM